MPVAPKRAVGSSEPSAYERFHSTFQAAVTQELEALVGDLRSAAARVADQPVNLSDPPRGDGALRGDRHLAPPRAPPIGIKRCTTHLHACVDRIFYVRPITSWAKAVHAAR